MGTPINSLKNRNIRIHKTVRNIKMEEELRTIENLKTENSVLRNMFYE